jgi:excisionase family DNA binding protein
MRANRDGQGKASVARVLAELDRPTLFQAIATLSLMQDLLQGELHRRMSAPREQPTTEKYLTVDEVAARLKLKRARVYSLIREGTLPKRGGLGVTVRVPASALSNGHNQGQKP